MLGSLTSLTGGGGLTGGSSGPAKSGNTSNTTNNSGFTTGTISLGSNNGIPWWGIALIALVALYVLTRK
ncbi:MULTISPECIES: hypothetical protein [Vibrio]|uniref:hypothetical protein n=1 Tax=Vibrio TaxID=662 RepID=UPI000C83529F|nr:hypothetical protein [Vibrio splendidus]PMO52552.1 hypothetical protein BCT08_21415 [Vibrio splendidus]